tara:strand:- start:247 stop:600 length:354 start_codon:yes stop_codon:yes gene_type:complete
MYDSLRKAIKKILLEDHHAKRGSSNNSLHQTLDNGNVNYEYKINEFYSINEYDTYDQTGDSFKLTIKVRESHKDEFIKNGISIDTIFYESSDINIFQNEKRNIINRLYVKLGNSGII